MAGTTITQALHRDVRIPADSVQILGSLDLPAQAVGVVVFAHGSGSGRHSPRNQFVAAELRKHGLGTLLIDLLSEDEEQDRSNVFDIRLLARRLSTAARWLGDQDETARLPVGYFGASTGAGAALVAAAEHPKVVKAVVSRGGRPDLAGTLLQDVESPTLLIVGGDDEPVIDLNELAQDQMTSVCELVIVPGATHLFEEPGTLEQVAELAQNWFLKYLAE